MPKIKISLAKQLPGEGIMHNGYSLSGADPDDRKACRRTAPVRLYPGNVVEMDVTHGHLTYLMGDRMVNVEVLDPGPKPVSEKDKPKQNFDYPWQEVAARRKEEDPAWFAEQERLASIRAAENARDQQAQAANKK